MSEIKQGDDNNNSFEKTAGTIADQRLIPGRRHSPTDSHDTGLERRRGPGRRRSDLMRSAEEGEMTDEQFLFLMAIDAFKRVNQVTYPTWSDIMEIIRRLGYRKVQHSQIRLANAEDWTERADSPISPETIGENDHNLTSPSLNENDNLEEAA